MPIFSPLFVITGQLAAGKTTLARALVARFPFGYHIDVDGIREMVTTGRASPLDWTDETTRQFDLALEGSAVLAAVYLQAGFAVAIEGGMDPAAIDRRLEAVELDGDIVRVSLEPTLDVALDRNRLRTTKAYDTSILDDAIREIDGDLRTGSLPRGWHRVDNSVETVDETADRILSLRTAR